MRGKVIALGIGVLALVAWALTRKRASVSITETGNYSPDGSNWFHDSAVDAAPQDGSFLDEIAITVQRLPGLAMNALQPIGVRQNNPMHVRTGAQKWQGEVAGTGGYEWFATDEDGIRAGARTLLNYQRLHKLRTVKEWITRYAPRADNNPTDAYIENVAAALGVDAEKTVLDLESQPLMRKLVRAVIRQEIGASWSVFYSDELIARAVARAYA